MNQDELQNKIMELIRLKEQAHNLDIIDMLDKQIQHNQKLLNNILAKNNNHYKKKILEQLGSLTEQIKKAELNDQLALYKQLTKRKKELNTQLTEIQGELKYLSIVQIKRILKAIEIASKTPLRDSLIILLGFEGGLRASEIIDFKITDLKLQDSEIYCRRKKGSIHNYIKISIETLNLIKRYLSENLEISNFLFLNSKNEKLTLQGINHIFKKYSKLANIESDKRHFHTLKHSRGVWLAENGFSLLDIKYLLGHKQIKSTMIYASFSKAQKDNIFSKLDTTSIF